MLLVRAEPPAPPAATLGDTSKRVEYDREMARKNDIATHRWNSDVFSSGGAQTRSSQAAAAKKLCHSCQFRNDATASTCARCANSLLRACAACGKMMDVGSACWACGYKQTQSAAQRWGA